MSLDALKADPQVREALDAYEGACLSGWKILRREPVPVRDALLAAVVAAHDRKYADLLARWTAWREAREAWMNRESFDVETEKALVSAGAKAEAALAAWRAHD